MVSNAEPRLGLGTGANKYFSHFVESEEIEICKSQNRSIQPRPIHLELIYEVVPVVTSDTF
jgi:hypothetical protein